jgi:hypothetical protein
MLRLVVELLVVSVHQIVFLFEFAVFPFHSQLARL